MPLNPPAAAPPRWPRLGARRADTTPSGGMPPAPVEIPLCWLSQPVPLRLERPFTTAEVTRFGHGTAYAAASARRRAAAGDQAFTATLHSACSADPSVLAHWTVTHRSEARTRSPELVINLMHRSDAERALILSIRRNQRIKLTGVPPEFPEGAASLVVSGISDDIGVMVRRVRFTTRPVVGVEPGVPGPWWRAGFSPALGSSHIIPF